MSHPIRVLCLEVLQHEVPKRNPPSAPTTQGSRLSQDSNTNNTRGASHHIPQWIEINGSIQVWYKYNNNIIITTI